MAGLPTKSNLPQAGNSHAMQQLYRLFESQGGEQSSHAHAHWQQVLRLGFPHAKLENWKYTPVAPLLGNQFFSPASQTVSREQIDALALPLASYRLVFIDGRLSAELSDSELGDFQVEAIPASRAGMLPEPIQSEVFLHLTESLSEQPQLIRVAAGKQVDKPLYLLHLSTGRDAAKEINTAHHRYHVQIERGAQVEVIEHYVSLGEQGHFTGTRLTVEIGDNAEFTHCKLAFESQASYHFAHNDLVVGRDAKVTSHSFLLGAGLTCHNTSAQLNGENSVLNINTLVLPIGKEICDTRTYLEHNKGYCLSRQLHKVIVHDSAKAVFNGMIKVAKHALKTDGQMTNNNLLLSKQAEVDTKPQLEIYADDVKCSHGATVGRIDDEQLFYLRSRGIDVAAAEQMIIFAFAAALTEALGDETLRNVVLARIAGRLRGGVR